MVFKHP